MLTDSKRSNSAKNKKISSSSTKSSSSTNNEQKDVKEDETKSQNNNTEQSFDNCRNTDLEQSSMISNSFELIDTTSITNNLIPTASHKLPPVKNGFESTNDDYETSLKETDEVINQQNDKDTDLPLTPLPHIDSNSLENDIKKIEDAKTWSYESEEEFEKRKQFATQILDDMTPEEFQKIKESPLELENLQLKLQIRADAYYRSQYEDRLEQFFTKWQEMKKLYLELIELYCKDNSSNRIWLKDAIICIQEDLKSYHNFSFTEKLSDYVTEHFMDKKTQEYLINKYGNDISHDLGFKEWRNDLKKTRKQREWEKQNMINEFRKNMI